MIACHCSFFFWVWCCLFYSFIVPSSFCQLHFVTVFCNFISFCFHMLLPLGGLVLYFIHPLVLLCFPTFVYDCVLLWLFFLLGMVLSFYEFIVPSFLVICLFRCMIVFHCGLCTLLSFGHVIVFLIPLWFISFNQSKELHFVAFVILHFFLLGILLSFYSSIIYFIYPIK